MKRALAILAACSLFGTFALGQTFSGEWDFTLTISPSTWGALGAYFQGACIGSGDLITLSSDFTLTYEVCGWALSSVSGFDEHGFSSQQFTANYLLGPFTFEATMNFIPTAVTEYKHYISSSIVDEVQTGHYAAKDWLCCNFGAVPTKWEPKFDDLKVTAEVSFGGVTLGALAFLEQGYFDKTYEGFFELTGTAYDGTFSWNAEQTHSTCTTYKNGIGWRFMISGQVGDCTLTSYTYFNLTERSKAAATARAIALGGGYLTDLELGKSGSGFYIANEYDLDGDGVPECVTGFTEEYLLLEGLTFACTTIDMALTITCAGFDKFEVLFDDVPFPCCGISFDALVSFGLTSKTVTILPKLTADWACLVFDVQVDFTTDHTLAGLAIRGISIEYSFNDCSKIVSDTSFDGLNDTYHVVASAVTGGKKAWYLAPSIMCATQEVKPVVTTQEDKVVVEGGKWLPVCLDQVKYHIWEKFGIELCGPGCCGGEYEFSAYTYFGDKYELAGYGFAYYDGTNWAYYWTETVGAAPAPETDFATKYETATGSAWSPAGAKAGKASVTNVSYYKAATNDNLFSWVKTDVDLSIPVSDSIKITAGLVVSVFGFDSIDLGFTFTF